jgi:hypothetical protein
MNSGLPSWGETSGENRDIMNSGLPSWGETGGENRDRCRRSAGVKRRPGWPGWDRAGAIPAAADGPIVGAGASDIARFGRIDRRTRGALSRGPMPFDKPVTLDS